MDVICERCKAEYEFDEALLGEKGTTVKCSACGHVFRVLPPHRDLARSHLKLRNAKDGSVRALSSLRELQQRIRAGEISIDDELGRDGFPFRPLREVPELKNFFAPAPTDKQSDGVLHKTTVRPDASSLGSMLAQADKTVEGHVPGGAGATMAGRADLKPNGTSNRPPLPSQRARAAEPRPEEPVQPQASPQEDVRVHAAIPAEVAAESEAPQADEGEYYEPSEPELVHVRQPSEAQVAPSAPEPVRRAPQHVVFDASHAVASADAPVPPEARRRSFTKHTMMGVGPDELQLPPPPRMPSFERSETIRPTYGAGAPARSSVEQLAIDRVGSPHATLHGAPAPQTGVAGVNGSVARPSHASASYDRGGTLSPVHGVAANEAPSELVAPHEVPDSAGAATYGRTDALVARLQAEPPAPVLDVPDSARKLYLDDDEKGPRRVEEGSSKLWLSGLVLFLLGSIGWLGWLAFEGPDGEYTDHHRASASEADSDPSAASDAELQLADELPDEPVPPPLQLGGAASASATGVPVPSAQPSMLEAGASRAAPSTTSLAAPALAANTAASAPDAEVLLAPRSSSSTSTPAPAAAPASTPAPTTSPSPVRAANETATSPGSTAPDKPAPSPAPATKPAASASAPVAAKPTPGATPEATKLKPSAVAVPAKPTAVASTPAATGPVPAPGDYTGWVNKGDQLYSRGDHEGAQKAFKAALNARPGGSEANAGMGFALLSTGKAREALPYFDSAASSGYAEANIGLGDAYRKLGQPSSAIEAYQGYLDRLSRGSRADYARTQIDKLRGGAPPEKTDSAPVPAAPTPSAPTSPPPTSSAPAPTAPAGKTGYRPAGEFTEPAASSPP